MVKHFIFILIFGCGIFTANAQLMQSFVHQAEFGIGAGAAHYFVIIKIIIISKYHDLYDRFLILIENFKTRFSMMKG